MYGMYADHQSTITSEGGRRDWLVDGDREDDDKDAGQGGAGAGVTTCFGAWGGASSSSGIVSICFKSFFLRVEECLFLEGFLWVDVLCVLVLVEASLRGDSFR